jgi:hypothetical protein
MRLYHIWAITKIVLWLLIAIILYNFINIYEDPAIGIWFGLVSILLISWWTSFYLFLGINNAISSKDGYQIISESYKMSLLFGLFCLLNVILLLLSIWTKLLGALLLVGFMLLYMVLFTQQAKARYDR